MVAALSSRSAPRRLGRYELIAPLATGGMAELYLGRLRGRGGFEKLVAIKRMKPHLSDDPGFVAMFLDEGRIAARLTHPNICQVYELGDEDGQLYMAMEYVPGIPLSTILAVLPQTRDGFDLRVAAGILIQVSDGVHFAHEHKTDSGGPAPIVHRDVSPTNLLVTAEGVCKLVDFGIAKVLTEVSQTRTGVLKGKPSYMAPEQIRAEPVDRRADVFALGVVLWECVAGRRLFQGDSDFLIWQQITQDAMPRLRDLRPEVPQALDDVVHRALAKDRDGRHETAREFAADVRRSVATLGGPLEPAALATYLSQLCGDAFASRARLVSRALAGIEDENEDEDETHRHVLDNAAEPTASIRLRDHTAQVGIGIGMQTAADPEPVRRRWSAARWPATLWAAAVVLGVVLAIVWARKDDERSPVAAGSPAPIAQPAPVHPERASADASAIRREPQPQPQPEPPTAGVESAIRREPRAPVKPRPEPAPVAAADPGYYLVDSRPYARIYVDGKDHGETPLFRVPLPPGRHTVRAVLPDGRKQQFVIEIRSGQDLSSGRLRW